MIVGAGGLGSPVAIYLAALGIGKIGIIDKDKVEMSNLARQILFTTNDINKTKSKTAINKLRKINPSIQLKSFNKKLTTKNINKIANSYNIKSIQADGMDVLDVRQKTESALQEIRDGNGPILIEAKCYRFRGHSVQDPQFYRDKEEIEKWTNRDPIKTFKNFLIESGILFEDEIQKSEKKIPPISLKRPKMRFSNF